MKSFRLIAVLCLITTMVACGCGKKSNRLRVYGTVTWKGQPVPAGVLYFSPDGAKGNKGSDGFAVISNGKYDTNGKGSKGAVTGPQIVSIAGGDGNDRIDDRPNGAALFQGYVTSYDIPKDGGEVNFVVPDSQPLPSKPAATE